MESRNLVWLALSLAVIGGGAVYVYRKRKGAQDTDTGGGSTQDTGGGGSTQDTGGGGSTQDTGGGSTQDTGGGSTQDTGGESTQDTGGESTQDTGGGGPTPDGLSPSLVTAVLKPRAVTLLRADASETSMAVNNALFSSMFPPYFGKNGADLATYKAEAAKYKASFVDQNYPRSVVGVRLSLADPDAVFLRKQYGCSDADNTGVSKGSTDSYKSWAKAPLFQTYNNDTQDMTSDYPEGFTNVGAIPDGVRWQRGFLCNWGIGSRKLYAAYAKKNLLPPPALTGWILFDLEDRIAYGKVLGNMLKSGLPADMQDGNWWGWTAEKRLRYAAL